MVIFITLSPKFSSQVMMTTKKQTIKQGTAIANGARGPRDKPSAKKLATIPAIMAEILLTFKSDIQFIG